MRIYLIGFMATGKTTMGSIVANHLNVPFLDTDQCIEKEAGMSISQIFLESGEFSFRQLETKVIRQTEMMDKALIATGGGLPMHDDNMAWLCDHGITMYLQWSEDLLFQNILQHRNGRPLIADLTEENAHLKLKDLLKERIPVYEQSAMTLEMSGQMERDIAILEKACKYIW